MVQYFEISISLEVFFLKMFSVCEFVYTLISGGIFDSDMHLYYQCYKYGYNSSRSFKSLSHVSCIFP